LGRNLQEAEDFNDSISLIEIRRGADNIPDIPTNRKTDSIEVARRGRSRKPRDKSKNPKNRALGKPKFVQLREAMKEGGGRRRKKAADEGRGRVCDGVEAVTKGSVSQSSGDTNSSSYVPESDQGLILEVVLPLYQNTPKSGSALLQQGALDDVSQQRCVADPESSKLLRLQQHVGFNYNEPDEEVIKVLANDEHRDRLKKLEWEQKNGLQ
jgi:hypothetical protein